MSADAEHPATGAGEVRSEIERATDTDRLNTLDRILRWYIAAASQASSVLSPGDAFRADVPSTDGPEPATFDTVAAALEWFSAERPNLVANARAALDAGLHRRAWELALALSPIHMHSFAFDDWAILSELAVTAAESLADPTALAAALDSRGIFLFRRQALGEARTAHARALAIREEIGDEYGICRSLNALGLIGLRTRELTEASAYFAGTAERAHRIGEVHSEGLGRMNLAEAQLEAGDVALALQTVRPLPQFFAELHDPGYEGNAFWLLSWAERLAGDLAAAQAAIDTALRIAENAGNRMWEASWLLEAARVHLAAGDTDEAMKCCRMAASLQRQIGDHSREATALDCAGEVLMATGNAQDAAAFHREAARMYQQLGDNWHEALAAVHLADAEQALGMDGETQEHLTTALALLQQFPDTRAVQLRKAIQVRPSASHGG